MNGRLRESSYLPIGSQPAAVVICVTRGLSNLRDQRHLFDTLADGTVVVPRVLVAVCLDCEMNPNNYLDSINMQNPKGLNADE